MQPPAPTDPATGSRPGGYPAGGYPPRAGHPGAAANEPGGTAQFPAGPPLPHPQAGGQPVSAAPYPGMPGQHPVSAVPHPATTAFPPVSAPANPGALPPPGPRSGPGRHPVITVLIVVLLLITAGEGFLLYDVNNRLDRSMRAQARSEQQSNAALQARIKALEQITAGSLDSTAVATAVLPSVFRVDAGDFTGTAFAVGKAPGNGGTDLLTNYHVVESIYEKGTRTAALERDGQRFSVNIIKVDTKNDLALLESTEKFNRLTTAAAEVVPGSPIVVVGAPLGLAQSVTTGVVSAVRSDFPGEGGKTFIQFDAPINPGNSGGPVVNAQKQVVGIASAKAEDAEGIGLAIPISIACKSFSIC